MVTRLTSYEQTIHSLWTEEDLYNPDHTAQKIDEIAQEIWNRDIPALSPPSGSSFKTALEGVWREYTNIFLENTRYANGPLIRQKRICDDLVRSIVAKEIPPSVLPPEEFTELKNRIRENIKEEICQKRASTPKFEPGQDLSPYLDQFQHIFFHNPSLPLLHYLLGKDFPFVQTPNFSVLDLALRFRCSEPTIGFLLTRGVRITP